MAETPPFTLLFDGLHFDAPNKRTSPSKSAPDAARLAWSHREQLRQYLGPWLMLLCLCIFGFNSYEASYAIP